MILDCTHPSFLTSVLLLGERAFGERGTNQQQTLAVLVLISHPLVVRRGQKELTIDLPSHQKSDL